MKKNDGIEKENNINGKNTKQTNICENKMDEIEKKDINKRFKMLSKKRKRNETNKNKKETKKKTNRKIIKLNL